MRLWPVALGASEEEALFTPGWEQRQDFLTGYANGTPGSLPLSTAGISLSRKGVRLTAFCPNPDAEQGVEGTLLRLWEQSGVAGDVTVTLPEGFRASHAIPVNLRGEKVGKPVKIRNSTFSVAIGAYEPISYVLQDLQGIN